MHGELGIPSERGRRIRLHPLRCNGYRIAKQIELKRCGRHWNGNSTRICGRCRRPGQSIATAKRRCAAASEFAWWNGLLNSVTIPTAGSRSPDLRVRDGGGYKVIATAYCLCTRMVRGKRADAGIARTIPLRAIELLQLSDNCLAPFVSRFVDQTLIRKINRVVALADNAIDLRKCDKVSGSVSSTSNALYK